VALVVLAAIGSGSLLLQAAALGRPTSARLDLVRTVHALAVYRGSHAVLRLDGRRYLSTCLDHWGTRNRRADVVLNGWVRLPEIGGHLVYRDTFDRTAFELAGCPRPLVRHLTSELEAGVAMKVRRVLTDGVRTWAVALPSSHPPLELFVSVRTGEPVKLVLLGRRMRGASDVTYGPRR
jgi:hypothetical protein